MEFRTLLLFFSGISFVYVECNNCTCLTDAGLIDYSSLGRMDGAIRFDMITGPDGYNYSYNPCYLFKEQACVNSLVCQNYDKEYFWSVSIGDFGSTKCVKKGDTIYELQYTAKNYDYERYSFVTLVCDLSAEIPTLKVKGETSLRHYEFELISKCCCPGVCTHRLPAIESCTGTDGCTCKTDSGNMIDLTTLGYRDGTARFSHVPAFDGYWYSYNPCYPFDQLDCKSSAVCLESRNQFISYSIGDYNTASFYYDGSQNHILYTAPGNRQTDVKLVCDMSAVDPRLDVTGQVTPNYWNMTLTTKCACPGMCNPARK